jgi:hypothetical protein
LRREFRTAKSVDDIRKICATAPVHPQNNLNAHLRASDKIIRRMESVIAVGVRFHRRRESQRRSLSSRCLSTSCLTNAHVGRLCGADTLPEGIRAAYFLVRAWRLERGAARALTLR